jgi:hypothetical protein
MGIKSLFFVDDEPDKALEKVVHPAEIAKTTQPTQLNTSSEKFNEIKPKTLSAPESLLKELMDESNLLLKDAYNEAGFSKPNYQEFLDSIESLSQLPLDEKTKFITVFSTLRIQGVTKDLLVNTALKYIEILNLQKTEFKQAISEALNNEVSQKISQTDTLKQEILGIDTQIQKLVEQKNKISQDLVKIQLEIEEDSTLLKVKDEVFENCANTLIQTTNSIIQKLNNFI